MDSVKCPHCGGIIRDLWDYSWSIGSEFVTTDCDHCEKEIRIQRIEDVKYKALPVEVPNG